MIRSGAQAHAAMLAITGNASLTWVKPAVDYLAKRPRNRGVAAASAGGNPPLIHFFLPCWFCIPNYLKHHFH